MKENLITQKELKEMLHYNPDSGVFTWLISRSSRAKVGRIAGSVDVRGYIVIKLKSENNKGRFYKAHRLAWFYMAGVWPTGIDHINHIKDDNRLANIRESSQEENNKNTSLRVDNASGVLGVSFNKRLAKWIAQINVDRKRKHIGCFKDKFEAICARKSASNKYGYHPNHGAER